MINKLIEYIYKILIFSILVVILDKLLPEGNSKKYVKLVSGFILTFIIISPILTVVSNYKDVKNNLVSCIELLNIGEKDVAVQTISNIDNQVYIDEIFKENMKLDVENRIKGYGYVAKNIQIEYNKDENENYTSINNIIVEIIGEVENKKAVNDIKVVKISKNEMQQNKYELSEYNKNKIKNMLSLAYEINSEKIFIK